MTQDPNGQPAMDSVRGSPAGASRPQAGWPGRDESAQDYDPDSEPPETGYGYRPAEFSPDDFE